MPQRDDLTGHLLFHVADEGRGVVDPLRPRVDVAALPVAVAMPAKVDGVRGHPMPGHPARESFVAAAVLAKAVDDSEGDLGVCKRPHPIRQLGSVGRVEVVFCGQGALRRQDGRTLAESSMPLARPRAGWARMPGSHTARRPTRGWADPASAAEMSGDRKRCARPRPF